MGCICQMEQGKMNQGMHGLKLIELVLNPRQGSMPAGCRDDAALQAWWQELQTRHPAHWLVASLQSGIAVQRDSSPAAETQPSGKAASPLARIVAPFAVIPGPAPMEGQLVALQRALKQESSNKGLTASCSAIDCDMTAAQVCTTSPPHRL